MNLCTNPGFEVNTDDWTAVRAALTRITGDYKHGAACGQVLGTLGQASQYARFTLAAPVKGAYVASVWAKAPDATIPYFKVYLSNGTDGGWIGTLWYASVELAADGEWHQYRLAIETTVTDDLFLDVYCNYSANVDRTDKLYFDGVVLERISHPLLRGVL